VECSDHAEVCGRSDSCPTRSIWKEAAQAMFDKLHSITLADLAKKAKAGHKEFEDVH
jgi:DNA-binding IscR family transcriptional regulator